jgi:hypothetical protein
MLLLGCCSSAGAGTTNAVCVGGALCDRVGRCRGRDFQVLMGGLSSPGSMNGAVRAADSDIAVDPLGPDSEDSRVTIMGEGERLRRDATDEKGDLEREEEGPAYSGMGETRTVRSDITGTRKRALIFSHSLR